MTAVLLHDCKGWMWAYTIESEGIMGYRKEEYKPKFGAQASYPHYGTTTVYLGGHLQVN